MTPGIPGVGPGRRAARDRVCRIGDGGVAAGGGDFRRRGRAIAAKAGRRRGKGKHYSGCGWRVRIGCGESRAVAGQRQALHADADGVYVSAAAKAGRWRRKGKHRSGCGWRVRIGGGKGGAVAGQRQAPTLLASGRALVGIVKGMPGGSARESNPPTPLVTRHNGFEVRKSHRAPSTPAEGTRRG